MQGMQTEIVKWDKMDPLQVVLIPDTFPPGFPLVSLLPFDGAMND